MMSVPRSGSQWGSSVRRFFSAPVPRPVDRERAGRTQHRSRRVLFFSIGGGLLLLIYAVYRLDPVFMVGQAAGLLVYGRNLFLISRERAALADAVGPAPRPRPARGRPHEATNPVYTGLPTTVFEVMSRLAIEHNAIDLGQGFPDVDGPDDVSASPPRRSPPASTDTRR